MFSFDYFAEKKPQVLEVALSKYNAANMKVVFKKYFAYVRYLTFHETKEISDYSQRFEKHMQILRNEKYLKQVLDLYSI